jgi:hypothetical protein
LKKKLKYFLKRLLLNIKLFFILKFMKIEKLSLIKINLILKKYK